MKESKFKKLGAKFVAATANPPTTRVERPFAVTRAVSGRLIAEFNANGELFIKASNGVDEMRSVMILAPGDTVVATFTLDSVWHCGAAVFQPEGWTVGCDGEMSLTLGNVDFAYLNDSGYVAKDQNQRYNSIIVTFVYDTAESWIEGSVGKATDRHEVRSSTPESTPAKIGSHSVAFIAFSEHSAMDPKNPKEPKLHGLPSGGRVTLQPSPNVVFDPSEPLTFDVL